MWPRFISFLTTNIGYSLIFRIFSAAQPYAKRFFLFDTTNLSLAYFKDESAALAKEELDKGKFRFKDITKVGDLVFFL
jgi:hypothetical protein